MITKQQAQEAYEKASKGCLAAYQRTMDSDELRVSVHRVRFDNALAAIQDEALRKQTADAAISMLDGLEALKKDPRTEKAFAVLSEGPLAEIRKLVEQLR